MDWTAVSGARPKFPARAPACGRGSNVCGRLRAVGHVCPCPVCTTIHSQFGYGTAREPGQAASVALGARSDHGGTPRRHDGARAAGTVPLPTPQASGGQRQGGGGKRRHPQRRPAPPAASARASRHRHGPPSRPARLLCRQMRRDGPPLCLQGTRYACCRPPLLAWPLPLACNLPSLPQSSRRCSRFRCSCRRHRPQRRPSGATATLGETAAPPRAADHSQRRVPPTGGGQWHPPPRLAVGTPSSAATGQAAAPKRRRYDRGRSGGPRRSASALLVPCAGGGAAAAATG